MAKRGRPRIFRAPKPDFAPETPTPMIPTIQVWGFFSCGHTPESVMKAIKEAEGSGGEIKFIVPGCAVFFQKEQVEAPV